MSVDIIGQNKYDNYSSDIIAINGTDIVIIEVKTTLRAGDICDFFKNLNRIRNGCLIMQIRKYMER